MGQLKGREIVKDPLGMTISIWNRYFKQYNNHVRTNWLEKDLNQTMQMVALTVAQAREMTLVEASKVIQKGFRDFLWDIGFRKVDGVRVLRENLYSQVWWEIIEKRLETFELTPLPPRTGGCPVKKEK